MHLSCIQKLFKLVVLLALVCHSKLGLSVQTKTDIAQQYYQQACVEADFQRAAQWFLRAAKLGDAHAQYRMANLYFKGRGVQKDKKEALQWLRMAAANGLASAQYQLGLIYRNGIAAPRDFQKTRHWLEKAVACGNAPATIVLGRLYKGWFGHPIDRQKALEWFRKGASLGYKQAEYEVAWLLTQLSDEARAHKQQTTQSEKIIKEEKRQSLLALRKAADKGNPEAQTAIGNAYLTGQQGIRDIRLAVEFFQKAAQAESKQAAFQLAMIYFVGEGVIEQDVNRAVCYMEQSAKAGFPMAEYMLGEWYRKGYTGCQDCDKAFMWMQRAAKHGVPLAQSRLGDMYHFGMCAPKILSEAFYWYCQAAQREYTYAQLMISTMYSLGAAVDHDFEKSVYWQQRAHLHADYYLAEYQIGRLFEAGKGFDQDKRAAVKYYLRAANAHLALAQAKLGDLYSNTLDRLFDYDLAYEWYRKAAGQGMPYARYNLGVLLSQACVRVKGDRDKQAAAWLKKAAHSGFKPAMYQLAWLYFKGKGVRQSYARAYGWWYVALEDNYETVPEVIANVIERMGPNVRAKALQLSHRFQEKYDLKIIQ